MNRVIAELVPGLIGAAIGGVIGYYVYTWGIGHGLKAGVIPGALIGLGSCLLSSQRSRTRGALCGVAALGLGLFAEWQNFPFIADDSLGYFLAHVYKLNLLTLIMIGLGTFLFFLGHNLVLKLPPDAIAQIPFELTPVLHVLWLVGLIPTLSGLGRIIAGFSIRREPVRQIESPADAPLKVDPSDPAFNQQPINLGPHRDEFTVATVREAPASVTDRTTNILERKIPGRQTDEMNQ